MIVHVHAITADTEVNGPGRRAMLHLQGCTLGCPACFNPKTHPAGGGTTMTVEQVADALLASAPDGVTISGGEPFQQAPALAMVIRELSERGVDSILVFTGYDLEELEGMGADLEGIDVLVAGPFWRHLPSKPHAALL